MDLKNVRLIVVVLVLLRTTCFGSQPNHSEKFTTFSGKTIQIALPASWIEKELPYSDEAMYLPENETYRHSSWKLTNNKLAKEMFIFSELIGKVDLKQAMAQENSIASWWQKDSCNTIAMELYPDSAM